MNYTTDPQSDLKAARKMHVTAMRTGNENDYLLAADLFENCQRYDEARQCRDAAAALHVWTADEILRRES